MNVRSYRFTHPDSSRMRSAATNSRSTPNSSRYSSWAARLSKEKSASAWSLAPSAGRKYPWCVPPCLVTRRIHSRAKRSNASTCSGSIA